MILLDPDLDADPKSLAKAARRGAASKLPNLRLPAAATLSRFLGKAKAEVRLRGQVSVLLTGDEAVRRLNQQFRGKNKPTDVLSFPVDSTVPGSERLAGDLAISVATARRQAIEQDHSLATEIKVLILHGLLHLAGYDHETDTGQMQRRERLLRARLALPQGLIERASAAPAAAPGRRSKAAARVPHR